MSSKEILIRIILFLSDDLCDGIRRAVEPRIRPEMLDNERLTSYLLMGASKWNEDDHPRAADGRWTNGAPGYMKKTDAEKWEKTGSAAVSPKRFPDTLKKITEAKESLEYWESQSGKHAEDFANTYRKRLVAAQRELAEKMRQFKHENREKIEGKAKKKHNDKLVKEYRDLEDDIDYIEEKYADRESGSLTDLKWPKGRKGEKEKAKYEAMIKRRDELNVEIDWDIVDDE